MSMQLRENTLEDLPHNVLLVVFFELELVSNPKQTVLVWGLRCPGNIQSICDGWGWNTNKKTVFDFN